MYETGDWQARLKNMDLFTMTIAVSILIYVAIGSYAGRSIKRLEDYFVAGRQAPTILILGTLVASVMSTSIFMVTILEIILILKLKRS